MKHILYLFVAFFLPLTLQSQRLLQEKEIIQLIESSHNAFLKADLESSNAYAEKALDASTKINYSYGIAYSNFYIGQALCDLGKLNTSLKCLSLAEKEDYTKTDPLLMAEIFVVRSRLYSMISPDYSLKEQKKGFLFLNKITNKQDKAITEVKAYTNLAAFYMGKNDIDSLSYYLMEANHVLHSLKEENTPPQQLTNFYSLLGFSHAVKKQYDSANYYFEKSLNIGKKYHYKNTAMTEMAWGLSEFQRKKNDSALIHFMKALNVMEELHYSSLIPWASHCISETYLALGDIKKSNEYKTKTNELREKFSQEYIDFPKTTLNTLLDEQENNTQKTTNRNIIILIIIIVSLTLFFLYYFFIKHRTARKTINSQEEIIANKNQKAYLLEQKVNEAFEIVIQLAKENNPEFLTRFREVYPNFISALLKNNPKLLTSELTFCAYLYLNFSSKDIAQYTFVTPRAVQLRKNRLRKRLNISSDEDIYLWMKNLS
ncbi:tetratricopeptide repeat protein [Chryseobacterium paridis]|uniref:Tetratricopeptide repeat protein n=1 Tax=Chryseobacterium paridis TaxID=2800328 RepID=A0ABS1FZV9_9FLAO|nr:tetratricopeptide repeat protein [Chryseobacterium paridis]MBK1897927.1 tetratricopeptide repeat protein [Chryseobacterium paridis]